MILLFTSSVDLIRIPPTVALLPVPLVATPSAVEFISTLPLPRTVKPSVICVTNFLVSSVGLLAFTSKRIPPSSFVSNDAFLISKIGLLPLRLASSLKVNLPEFTDKFAAQVWWLDPVDSLCS